jgi:hypothetical protein
MATVHPSSILRAPEDEARHSQMRAFVEHLKEYLKKAASLAHKRPAA